MGPSRHSRVGARRIAVVRTALVVVAAAAASLTHILQLAIPSSVLVHAWTNPHTLHRQRPGTLRLAAQQDNETPRSSNNNDLEWLRGELQRYLKARQREAQRADDQTTTTSTPTPQAVDAAARGTRSKNILLDFMSVTPRAPQQWEEDPDDIFCYAELEKYGFTDLVAPIMENGGRLAMYQLMDLPLPAIPVRPETLPQAPAEIVIDTRGDNDASRFPGLRMGLLDDNAMAQALQETQRKQQLGLPLRTPIEEERFVVFNQDKRNVGPKMTPDWTPERIDEELSRQGDAISWARNARSNRLVTDAAESLDLDMFQLLYSALTASLVAVSFGHATPTFLTMMCVDADSNQLQEFLNVLKVPSVGLSALSVASSILCGMKASEKRRSPFIWTMKGLLGGPATSRQLNGLPKLLTRAELENNRV